MKALSTLILAVCLSLFAGIAQSENWVSYNTDNSGIADNQVNSVVIDSFGAKWFGTANGLSRFDGSAWTNYTDTDKLANNTVRDIAFEITSYGPEIWAATDGGVSVISVVPDAVTFATPYTTENTGLVNDSVSSAAVDGGHMKWFGTAGGLSTFTGSEWASYTINELLTVNGILSIAVASDGWVYLGTDGGGVNRFDGVTSASPYDTDWTGIASNTVTAGLIASDGTKWFGTDQGISKHEGDDTKTGWTTFTTADGLGGNHIQAIAEDSKGKIWAGTDQGLSVYDGAWQTVSMPVMTNINDIAVGEQDVLWLATGQGAAYYAPYPVSVEDSEELPRALKLTGAFPNPFNPSTSVEFTLAEAGEVELSIYNLAGQKVRTLVDGARSAGVHAAQWNGRDMNGSLVSSGVYVARLRMGDVMSSMSMTLLK